MKSDVQGCSTCPPGGELYEEFASNQGWLTGDPRKVVRLQYDYRTPDGVLFSCVAPTLEAARARRDRWLARRAEAGTT